MKCLHVCDDSNNNNNTTSHCSLCQLVRVCLCEYLFTCTVFQAMLALKCCLCLLLENRIQRFAVWSWAFVAHGVRHMFCFGNAVVLYFIYIDDNSVFWRQFSAYFKNAPQMEKKKWKNQTQIVFRLFLDGQFGEFIFFCTPHVSSCGNLNLQYRSRFKLKIDSFST